MTSTLSGFVIGITADRHSHGQVSELVRHGATCLHGPTIQSPSRPSGHSGRSGHPDDEITATDDVCVTMPDDVGPARSLVRAVCGHRLDALTFTARAAVENLLEIAAGMGRDEALVAVCRSSVTVYCAGPESARIASDTGLGRPLQPERSCPDALTTLVTSTLATNDAVVRLGGVAVTIRGRSVAVADEDPVTLAGRERQVLEQLLERPGAVHSKESLLAAVWGRDEADIHAVEVTVGRLRQRLGPAGAGIETIIRRGYRASAT